MSNIKRMKDKDGNDIFPVTHASAVFDDNKPLSDVIRKMDKKIMVSVEDFYNGSDADHTQAFKDAMIYCADNDKALYIPNGKWYISDTIEVFVNSNAYTGMTIVGESKNSIIYINAEKYAFEINAHRCVIENLTINGNNKGNGILCTRAQCNIENVIIMYCKTGITFTGDSWCSNTNRINMYNVHNGIVFENGSGGCKIAFDFMSGDAGYTNTVDNGSVAITFKAGAGWAVIEDGGQIDSFSYVFDIQNDDPMPVTLRRVYIEHNLYLFTPDSANIVQTDFAYMPGKYTHSNIIMRTSNGYNKTDVYTICKDSAIPVNRLLAYYTFNRNNLFCDLSNCGSIISNTKRLTLADDHNLFGPSSSICPPADGSISNITIPNLGNLFTIVVSFRHSADHGNNSHRIFELNTLTPTETNNLDVLFLSDAGNTTSFIDRAGTGVDVDACKIVLGLPPYKGNSSFVAFVFDLENGVYHGFDPYFGNFVTRECPLLTGYKDGNMKIGLFKSWTVAKPIVYNYLAVFDGALKLDELYNLYNLTKPLVNPSFLFTDIPTSSTSVGKKGTVAIDENYFYLCVTDNNWMRIKKDETW